MIVQTWTQAQKDAVKKLHRLGVWREVSIRQEDKLPDDHGFNSIWYDVETEVDLHAEYISKGLDREIVLSDREYRSAVKWLRETEPLFSWAYERLMDE